MVDVKDKEGEESCWAKVGAWRELAFSLVGLSVVCNHTTTLIASHFGFSRTDLSSNNDHYSEDKGKLVRPLFIY